VAALEALEALAHVLGLADSVSFSSSPVSSKSGQLVAEMKVTVSGNPFLATGASASTQISHRGYVNIARALCVMVPELDLMSSTPQVVESWIESGASSVAQVAYCMADDRGKFTDCTVHNSRAEDCALRGPSMFLFSLTLSHLNLMGAR
jgi:hypothetical protein